MRIRTILIIVAMLMLGSTTLATATAQTPVASPVAGGWQVTETREIAVEGEPVALSPDGGWLAGIAVAETDEEATQVCAWDVETLTPTCAEVPGSVEPFLGGSALSWAPDSSAFAFVSGSMPRLVVGDVFVFDLEARDVTNLTNTGDTEDGPMYIGADWTDDSAQVVYGVLNGLGSDSPPDALYRVDRGGGEPVAIPLPDWPGAWNILFPPLVADGAVTFAVSNGAPDIDGVWRVGLDGADPVLIVAGQGDPPIDFAVPVSESRDGRLLNVVSFSGLQRMEVEGTFFLFDTETRAMREMVSEDDLNLIAFGPDSATGLMVRADQLQTINLATGIVTPVANSPETGSWLQYIPTWADNDTIFLPGGDGGTLVTLAPAS